MSSTPKQNVVSLKDKLPPADLRVIAVGKQYRCLGYIDQDGIWRDHAHHNELHNVIGWMEI